MITLENLMTPQEVVEAYPQLFTAKQLDWQIKNRRRNGLDAAVVKIARKILIDKAEFEKWAASHQEGKAA